MSYSKDIEALNSVVGANKTWHDIDPEAAVRMRLQNRFKTHLDIAKYNAKIMREDMAAYDGDNSKYTQSLGCWHGFIGQQKMISIKKHFGDTKGRYLYLSGWMVAALRSEFGPLPDQSMHEKTAVADLIRELYTFLKQADAWELNHLFRDLDEAKAAGDQAKQAEIVDKIDNFQTHVVPIIADIDAGFGNPEEKQCGHQDGKVTVPHADFIAKINAVRYAFLELGVDDGVIVARTDSEGAGLTQKIAVTTEPGDLGDQYNSFLEGEYIDSADQINNGDIVIKSDGKLLKPTRLASGLFQFRRDTNIDRVVLDCVTSLRNGADLLWIETPTPNVAHIKHMVDRIREQEPNAKLVYNNSPSFNWTLNFRQQVFDAWEKEGKDLSAYDRAGLMSVKYDDTELAAVADEWAKEFQAKASREAGVFHHLITLPTYHTAALSTDQLVEGYFGEEGMLAYAKGVQRQEIRRNIATVKHQDMAGSNIGDDHKEYFSGEAALKAGGKDNTMNQF